MKKIFIYFLLVVITVYLLTPIKVSALTIDDIDMELNGTKVILKEGNDKYFFNTTYKAKNAFIEVNVPDNISVTGAGWHQLPEKENEIVVTLKEDDEIIYNFIIQIKKNEPTNEELKEIEDDKKYIQKTNIFIILMYIIEFFIIRFLFNIIEKFFKFIWKKIKKKV